MAEDLCRPEMDVFKNSVNKKEYYNTKKLKNEYFFSVI
jgi:hypothetical protein